ncbi:hypothetical protein CEXT_745591 [Caerostris extrusa]|uniref:Uncharacterized protein n=1 Tax=Caerostris extrusa TaxID=172846 RepID=A0AAV4P3V8_CAEEX|nr:hypothetical protein CEXT_745591 [Caerostris extrusa]
MFIFVLNPYLTPCPLSGKQLVREQRVIIRKYITVKLRLHKKKLALIKLFAEAHAKTEVHDMLSRECSLEHIQIALLHAVALHTHLRMYKKSGLINSTEPTISRYSFLYCLCTSINLIKPQWRLEKISTCYFQYIRFQSKRKQHGEVEVPNPLDYRF